jgi:tetratricopeptide (TPR) repeat protein
MSLLLQALQKAAKSREEGEADLSAEDIGMAGELSLDPIAPIRTPKEPAPSVTTPSSAQAATVMQASAAAIPRFDPMDYAREHYMVTMIGGAILLALCYGAYVYIQIAHPFRSSSPVAAPVAATPAAPVASTQPAQAGAKVSGLPNGATPSSPVVATPAKANVENVANVTATAASEKSTEARAIAKSEIVPTQKIAASATPRKRAAPSQVVTATPPLIDASDSIETVTVPSSHAQVSADAKPANDIAVRRDAAGVVPVSPMLMQAYEMLQAGDTAGAKTLYENVLITDPRNVDALLGVAAIAKSEGRFDDTNRLYQRVLELEPRNSYAQAGLISIVGGADLAASESRLKQLIARDPSAFLYFSLGNLYAEQSQWPSAQQAYFQAYQMQPDNPDYAFNLAIGLDHIGQSRPALDYYRKALDLSFKKGHASFDQSLVIQRVGQLSTRGGQ